MKWLALLFLASCAGRTGEILRDTGDLSEAAGRPRIDGVLELGGGDVLLTAPLVAAAGDGVAMVGEALWVRGSDFGRQPTVTIAGRPAAVLARTVDGGLVVRVPAGVPVGAQTLSVANQHGQGARALSLKRVLATIPAEGGKLVVAELGTEGPRAGREFPVSGRLLRVSGDGRAAYVLDGKGAQLTVFELPSQGGPRQATTLTLAIAGGDTDRVAPATVAASARRGTTERVVSFAAAAIAPVLMIVSQRQLLLLDTTSPLRPLRGQRRPLPLEIQKGNPVVAALSPDGRVAAVLLEEGNRLALLDVGGRGPVTVLAEMSLSPGARVPVLADVAFVADGRTVWVALGDTAKSRAVGPQPTELVAVRFGRATPEGGVRNEQQPPSTPGESQTTMAVARRVRLSEAQSPVLLNTGRARPLPSGASIRLPPERSAVYLTARNRAGAATIFRLGADDHATSVLEMSGAAGAADLSPDGRWLVVPVVQPGGPGDISARLTLVAAPADDHPGARQVLDLGAAPAAMAEGSATDSRRVPSVACQP